MLAVLLIMEFITSVEFEQMIKAASQVLNENAEKINKLNVFPVPDGDTGTNMSMSLQTGVEYIQKSGSKKIGELSVALSKGLLMGARGNSGVILSQIFRGISKYSEELTNLNAEQFATALDEGRKMAYKAVMKPTEGTILTVIRLASEAAKNAAKTNDVIEVAKAAFEASKKALATTPDLLPVLKEVGVVDSGGQGLVFVLKAFYEVLSGEITPEDIEIPEDANFTEATTEFDAQISLDPNDIVFGYCTTILLEAGKGTTFTKKWNEKEYHDALAKLGDSLLILSDGNMIKTHVHVEDPGKVLSIATKYGSIASVKIDNMRDQQQEVIDRVNREKEQATKNAPETAVIAVASGQGLVDLFISMGVTDVISGGQTMNPSTQDLLDAINKSGAKKAIILPNNSNIFMSANQAAEMSDIPVEVVKSRTIQQGITAMLGFNTEIELSENAENMSAELKNVKSLEMTKAVRDTNLDGHEIKDGDWLMIADGEIIANGKKPKELILDSIEKITDDDDEIITMFYGDDVSEKEAKSLATILEKKFPDMETEVHSGGQKLYPLLLSIE